MNEVPVACEYCIDIYNTTPASPRRRYKYCPMCGRRLDFRKPPILIEVADRDNNKQLTFNI